MKKKNKQNHEAFDEAFDRGELPIDFSSGVVTEGLSKVVKIPPLAIPSWMALEIDNIAKLQGNSRAAVIRQLLQESIARKIREAP